MKHRSCDTPCSDFQSLRTSFPIPLLSRSGLISIPTAQDPRNCRPQWSQSLSGGRYRGQSSLDCLLLNHLLKINFKGSLPCTTVQVWGGASTGPLTWEAWDYSFSEVLITVPVVKSTWRDLPMLVLRYHLCKILLEPNLLVLPAVWESLEVMLGITTLFF